MLFLLGVTGVGLVPLPQICEFKSELLLFRPLTALTLPEILVLASLLLLASLPVMVSSFLTHRTCSFISSLGKSGKSSRPHPRLCPDGPSDSESDELAPSLVYRSPLSGSPSPPPLDDFADSSDAGGLPKESPSDDDDGNASLLRSGPANVEPVVQTPEELMRSLLKSSSSEEPSPVRSQELESLLANFKKLKMSFLVRCKFPVCSFQGGALQDLWQNNITVRGVLLRRMQCFHCHERLVDFAIVDSSLCGCCLCHYPLIPCVVGLL